MAQECDKIAGPTGTPTKLPFRQAEKFPFSNLMAKKKKNSSQGSDQIRDL